MKQVLILWKREVVRFYRQPSRVLGAIGSPLVFWFFIGSGMGSSFQSQDFSNVESYGTYFFPGILLMIVLFSSIFSTISVIEDRKEGFLQAVLVSPVSRFSIVLGKVLGGVSIALFQSIIFLCLLPLAKISITTSQIFLIVLILLINAYALTSLGFLMAWQFKSIQGFHAVMNLLLFPMWILSGALFPLEGAASWIQIVMKTNPLHYGMNALHEVFFGQANLLPWQPITVVFTFGSFMLLFCTILSSRRSINNVV